MASNRNFDGLRFLVGSSLVGAKGFLKSQGPYLGSAFGTSTPSHNGMLILKPDFFLIFLSLISAKNFQYQQSTIVQIFIQF